MRAACLRSCCSFHILLIAPKDPSAASSSCHVCTAHLKEAVAFPAGGNPYVSNLCVPLPDLAKRHGSWGIEARRATYMLRNDRSMALVMPAMSTDHFQLLDRQPSEAHMGRSRGTPQGRGELGGIHSTMAIPSLPPTLDGKLELAIWSCRILSYTADECHLSRTVTSLLDTLRSASGSKL